MTKNNCHISNNRMAKQIKGARKLIDDRGGRTAIRDALGWAYTTVNNWYQSDQMPDYRATLVKRLAKRRKAA